MTCVCVWERECVCVSDSDAASAAAQNIEEARKEGRSPSIFCQFSPHNKLLTMGADGRTEAVYSDEKGERVSWLAGWIELLD